MSLLMLIGLYVLSLRAKRTRGLLQRNKPIVVLFAYMAVSALWSNFPEISLRRDIRSTGTFLMVLVVLTECDPLESVRALLRRLYLVHIPLSIVAIKYFRNIGVVYNWNGIEEEWTGVSIDKNSLGAVSMCSGLFWSWQFLKDRQTKGLARKLKALTLPTVMILQSLWLLRGSKNIHSSASIIGFAACCLVILTLQVLKTRVRRAKRIVLGGTVAMVLAAPFLFATFSAFDTTPAQAVVDVTGRDMTFTDRTLIWTDVLNNATKSPVLGVGIGAFWVGPIGYAMYPMPNWSRKTPSWRPEEAHNGYIDTYVELGAVGLILLLIVIGSSLAGAFSHLQWDFQFGSLRLVLLLSILMNNLAETTFLSGTHGLWFLFLLLAVNHPRPNSKVRLEGCAATAGTHGGPLYFGT
jgi:O-antigen ligase